MSLQLRTYSLLVIKGLLLLQVAHEDQCSDQRVSGEDQCGDQRVSGEDQCGDSKGHIQTVVIARVRLHMNSEHTIFLFHILRRAYACMCMYVCACVCLCVCVCGLCCVCNALYT